MKKLFLSAAFIGMMNSANAQCEDVIDIINDSFAKTSFEAQKYPIKTNEMTIFCLYSSHGHFVMKLDMGQKVSCIREDSQVQFLLDNDEILNLKHSGDFNCSGDIKLMFNGLYGNKKEYQKLKEREIICIRAYHMRGFVETYLTEEQRQGLKLVINCLQLR